MQNVHLYFIKLFGCHIKEAGIPIDLKTFANAILNEKAHPQVYLKFGRISSPVGTAMAGSTDIDTAQLPDGSCAFASWFYEIGELAINIMFAIDGEERQGLVGAWHPKFGTNKLRFEDLMRVS